MGFKMDVKWKIRVNGKEYGSVEEMPAAERAIYENAMKESAASGHTFTLTTRDAKIVFNGREYANVDSLPEEARETYRNLMKAVAEGKSPTDETIVSEAAQAVVRTQAGGRADLSRALRPIAPESFSARKLVVGAAVLAVLAALYFLARG